MKKIFVLFLILVVFGCSYNGAPLHMIDYRFDGTGAIQHLKINYYEYEYVLLPFHFVQFVPDNFSYNVYCTSFNPVTLTITNDGVTILKTTSKNIVF